MADKKDVGALWRKEKDGKEYFTGNITIGETVHEIVVFSNSYKKEGSNQPDYRIYPSRPKGAADEEQSTDNPSTAEVPF